MVFYSEEDLDTRDYTHVGVMLFVHRNKSNKFTDLLNKCVDRNTLTEYDMCQYITSKTNSSYKNWDKNLDMEKVKEKQQPFLTEEELSRVLSNKVSPNVYIKTLYNMLSNKYDSGEVKKLKWWDGILGVNMVCSKWLESQKYDNCNYSFFTSKLQENDSLKSVALRSLRRKARLYVHDSIFNRGYQNSIRQKYKLTLPVTLTVKRGDSVMKLYLLMADNFWTEFAKDNLGSYVKMFRCNYETRQKIMEKHRSKLTRGTDEQTTNEVSDTQQVSTADE